MRARLLAARGEKERARATLKGAQQAEREALEQLRQVLRENAALEAELVRQTVSGFGGNEAVCVCVCPWVGLLVGSPCLPDLHAW